MPRSLTARALVLGGAAALVLPASALAGTITGTAYLDRNSNGTYDIAAFTPGALGSVVAGDAGVPGVVVRAYDNLGAPAGTATSGVGGTYSLSTSASGTVRLEFTTPTGYQPSFHGARNGTSVQFVDTNATGADFGLVDPAQYCQDNPSLVTCVPSITDSQTSAPTNAGGILLRSTLEPMTFATKTGKVAVDGAAESNAVLANNSAMGAVFGVGVDRQRNAFFGTYVKRHSPYGPAGATNTIYRKFLDNADPSAVSTFVTLPGTLPAHAATNPAPHNGASPPYPDYAADGNRNLNPGDPGYSNVYSMIGRVGLGDVDVTPDGSTLLAVDMNESAPKLWSVPLSGVGNGVTAGTPTAQAIPVPSLTGAPQCVGTWHPMGIGVRGTRVLVGGVCSPDMRNTSLREQTGNTVTITTAQDHGFAVGDWVRFDGNTAGGFAGTQQITAVPSPTTFEFTSATSQTVASTAYTGATVGAAASDQTQAAAFVEELSGGTFTTIAGFRLSRNTTADYPKSKANGIQNVSSGNASTGSWVGWLDGPPPFAAVCLAMPSGCNIQSLPQPMLANIEIADNGDLVLGMRDRFMDQNAVNNSILYEDPLTDVANPKIVTGGFGAAETVRLCNTGSGFAVESQGACPSGLVGAKQPSLFALATKPTPLFYWNGFIITNQYGSTIQHPTTSLGGLAMMPGSETVWSTAYDIDNAFQQGIKVFGTCPDRVDLIGPCGPSPSDNGAQVAGIEFPAASASFKKGNGLGDLEIVCDSAPVEIGNYVWIDSNGNGIQDPGEPAVAGVTVHLYDASNTLVGTAITDANGQYYFDSNITEPAGGESATPDNVGGGLVAGAAFTIRLDNPQDYAAATHGPLAPYDLTATTQSSVGAGSQSTAVDSNATVVSNYPQIAVPSRSAGFNNHTFDVGFVTSATPPWPLAILVGMGDYTWIDSNSNGVQDVGEAPLPGVQVQLLDAAGNVATDALGNPVSPVTTDAQGAYFIGNLLPGNYRAQFTLPSGYTFTTTGGGTSATDSNPTAGADPLVGVTPAFTIGRTASGDTTAVAGHPDATVANLTIDAGVVAVAGDGSGGSAGPGGSAGSATSGGTQGAPGAVVPSSTPGGNSLTPFQGAAVVPPRGLPVDGAGRIVVVIENPLDAPAEAMTTVIVVPRGFRVISAGGGTVIGRTITYTDIDVPAGGRRVHALYVRAAGRPRTVSIPVTVTTTGSTKVQRTVIKARVRATRSGPPAVTG